MKRLQLPRLRRDSSGNVKENRPPRVGRGGETVCLIGKYIVPNRMKHIM